MRADWPLRDVPPDRREEMRREISGLLPGIVCSLHDRAIVMCRDLDLGEEDDWEPIETYVRDTRRGG